MNKPFFRYCGGKRSHTWLKNWLKCVYLLRPYETYCEPFAGAGGVFWQAADWFLKRGIAVRLNDYGCNTAAVWNAALHYPVTFQHELQRAWVISHENFARHRAILDEPRIDTLRATCNEVVRRAVAKMFTLHLSYLGQGGRCHISDHRNGATGKAQEPQPTPEERAKILLEIERKRKVTVNNLCRNIASAHDTLRKLHIIEGGCTSYDFQRVINENPRRFLFMDPPYFMTIDKPRYYEEKMEMALHEQLGDTLTRYPGPWILTYDLCDDMKRIYDHWAFWGDVPVNCTIGNMARGKRTKKLNGKKQKPKKRQEVIIMTLEQERATPNLLI